MMMERFRNTIYNYRYTILFFAIVVVYFINMFIDVMEVDAAQYALISMEMSWTKSFLEVFQQGKDYLDKPPLLFWLSSSSFIFFGISNFTYKLPSVLIALLGIYSTYRFAKIWYSKKTAVLSSLILASCQALFLITNDVRTDTNLLGLVMFSIWQLSEYVQTQKWKHLILSAIGIGGAMMAKGPIALVIPATAFGSDFLIKRQWKNIFKPQWIVLLILVAFTLVPMSYGLYTQFDLHPEKTVYGLNGPSGLRFFYWIQSFGRITGENYWENDTGFFYFFHTILWDFQPWVFLFIPSLILKFRQLILKKRKYETKEEFITLGGFVLIFVALSMSKYKLPHYIFVLFPFASILTADFIYQLKENLQSRVAKMQFGIMHIFWLAMAINYIFFFPPENIALPLVLLVIFVINWLIFKNLKIITEQIFIPTLITAISFNLMMGLNFYPSLLKYQATSQAGKMVAENKVSKDMFYYYKNPSFSLDFYAQRITPEIKLPNTERIKKGSWIYTNKKGLYELEKSGLKFKKVKTFPSFKVTALELPFLYKKTRATRIKSEFIVELI